jgi:hypothetical protein
MRVRRRSVHLGAVRALLLAVVSAAPAWVRGAEPLPTIREAFRASSQGLSSGLGKGIYRHYRAFAGGDWQLKVDADVSVYLADGRYHIDLVLQPSSDDAPDYFNDLGDASSRAMSPLASRWAIRKMIRSCQEAHDPSLMVASTLSAMTSSAALSDRRASEGRPCFA